MDIAQIQQKSYPSQIKAIAILLGLYAILRLAVFLFWPQQIILASDLTVENILSAINRERQLRNLLTLNANSKLSVAAQSKSDDMIARHYFSHTDPEGNYIWPKIEAAGYTPYLQLGENLAIEFYNTDSLVSAWMNSPTHRANILNENFKDQGMGLAFGDVNTGQYYSAVTNTFGALLAKPKPEPVLSNTTQTTQPPAPKTATPPPAKTTTTPPPAPITEPTPAAPAPATVPAKPVTPIAIRSNNEQPSFTTVADRGVSTTTPSTTTKSAPAVTSTGAPKLYLTDQKASRYLTLGLGIILMFLLLSDLKIALDNQLKKVDKKINNIFLLILAIVAVALLYWM